MMDNFCNFVDLMSRESGQVALCEAIKTGYAACHGAPVMEGFFDNYRYIKNGPNKGKVFDERTWQVRDPKLVERLAHMTGIDNADVRSLLVALGACGLLASGVTSVVTGAREAHSDAEDAYSECIRQLDDSDVGSTEYREGEDYCYEMNKPSFPETVSQEDRILRKHSPDSTFRKVYSNPCDMINRNDPGCKSGTRSTIPVQVGKTFTFI